MSEEEKRRQEIREQDEKNRIAVIEGRKMVDHVQYLHFLKEREKDGGSTDYESFKTWQAKRDLEATKDLFNPGYTPPKKESDGERLVIAVVFLLIIFAIAFLVALF